ncbi:MAG: M24 family metallopeptidase [Armatimonadetes bacterium]|nr:M24 family metallopeptidase [Armatimonadota bacterium]MDW8027573.1 M24 family metallopeptidase [Armatimonadota bacterium]
MDWKKCQQAVRQFGLDGWLIWNYRGRNQIANALVDLPHQPTRTWFCLIAAEGEPRWLVPRLELNFFASVQGSVADYGSRQELIDGLKKLLFGTKKLALEYSHQGELPMISFVDAGTFELLKSFGVEIVSSADLVHWVLGRVDDEGLKLHRQAAQKLMQLKDEAFGFIVDALVNGQKLTEWQVQQFLLKRMGEEGLTASHQPIVAAMINSANPHYFPTEEKSAFIGWGDFVLLDIFAKVADNPKAVYADITWCGYTGSTVPPRFQEQFAIVKEARDAAVEFLRKKVEKGEPVRGCDVDDVARSVIAKHGRAKDFVHRTGHSLGIEVHGLGVNLDNYETCDTRLIVAGSLFTVEPGIYGPEIGTRTEINIVVHEGKIEITTLPLQDEIVPLL